MIEGSLGSLHSTRQRLPVDENLLVEFYESLGVDLPVLPDELTNVWPESIELGYQQRARRVIDTIAENGPVAENRNRSAMALNLAMVEALAGLRGTGLAAIEQEESKDEELHLGTEGLDFYDCEALRDRARAWFLFRKEFGPQYRARVADALGAWVESDPLYRPHYAWNDSESTGPEGTNSWVDPRNTDNLRAMRETSVYLFAEYMGNRELCEIYAQRLQRYVWALYHIGMGEWEAKSHHGKTFAAWLNLFDFARDWHMRSLAKAALDWLTAAAALKYFQGAMGGPNSRDDGDPLVGYGTAAQLMWLYAGNGPDQLHHYRPLLVHPITSRYRPPAAVIALARNQFNRPAEFLNGKPEYKSWCVEGETYAAAGYQDAPHRTAHYETLYFGETFMLGSLASAGDRTLKFGTSSFKLVAHNSKRGADYFVPGVGRQPEVICTRGLRRSAQYRNLAICLHPDGASDLMFLVPKSAEIVPGEVLLVRMEKTWLAIHPIHVKIKGPDSELTRTANARTTVVQGSTLKTPRWPDERILSAKGLGERQWCGFALEVGEALTHGSWTAFCDGAREETVLNLTRVDEGFVDMQDQLGKRLTIDAGRDDEPVVHRNGPRHLWNSQRAIFKRSDGGSPPISLGWKEGELIVDAGDFRFTQIVDDDGNVSGYAD